MSDDLIDTLMDEEDEVHCWVCDAIANPILDADGNFTGGTDCRCDDHGYDTDGIWR